MSDKERNEMQYFMWIVFIPGCALLMWWLCSSMLELRRRTAATPLCLEPVSPDTEVRAEDWIETYAPTASP